MAKIPRIVVIIKNGTVEQIIVNNPNIQVAIIDHDNFREEEDDPQHNGLVWQSNPEHFEYFDNFSDLYQDSEDEADKCIYKRLKEIEHGSG